MLDGYLGLSDKYQVASEADAFLTPFHWRLHDYLDTPPALIVDCGAHFGRLTALAKSCIRYRFGKPECR